MRIVEVDENPALYREAHIPGAIRFDWQKDLQDQSAQTWFVLHELLGATDVKNYDGSWTEWGNLVNVPIEKS